MIVVLQCSEPTQGHVFGLMYPGYTAYPAGEYVLADWAKVAERIFSSACYSISIVTVSRSLFFSLEFKSMAGESSTILLSQSKRAQAFPPS